MTNSAAEMPLSVPALRKRHATRTKKRLVIVGVVLIAAVGFLLYKGLTSAIVYFKTAQQAVAARSTLGNSTFQIEGTVVAGSEHRTGANSIAFAISSGKTVVQVNNQGTPPQLFGSKVPVVLVGHFVGKGNVFSSNEILVKHSNEYIAQHPKRVTASNGSVH